MAAAFLVLHTSTTTAQSARFFRVAGSVPTTITDVAPSGTITWTNVPASVTFTVQTALALDGQSNWVDWVQVPASNAVTVHRIFDPKPPSGMVLIPAGSFTMGDTLDGPGNAVPVTATISVFYMDEKEVSWSQWQSVYDWATNHGYSLAAGAGKAANHPVQTVRWYDCVKWCNARSEQAGLTPVYYTDAAQMNVYRTGAINISNDSVNWGANGYRLPTEAEWEKAARGGLSGQRFPWGKVINQNLANYQGATNSFNYDLGPNGYHPLGDYPNTSPGTTPVGTFAANGYGPHDMAGNVWEWCWDWYGTPYAGGSDPQGPVGPLSDRVLRGGDWYAFAVGARCASRYYYVPGYAGSNVGFRCVMRGL